MKKIYLAVILMLFTLSMSFGAESADMSEYVRKDVLEVHLQTINMNTEAILKRLDVQDNNIKELTKAITMLTERIQNVNDRLGERIGGVSDRLSDLRQDIYLGLVILGIMAALPSVKEFFKWREDRKDSRVKGVTLEEVRRLIEEAKLGNKTSV